MFTELMKQAQYSPLSVSKMAVTLYAANNGYFDDVPVEKILTCESDLHGFIASKHKKVMESIEKNLDLSEKMKKI